MTTRRRALWAGELVTYSGHRVWPSALRPRDVRLVDVAHALANQGRFAGHAREFYSVAQHSVYVSHLADRADALAGLLHDACEAYVGDLVAPVKRLPALAGYRALEARVADAIAGAFGVPTAPPPASVARADRIMLAVELRDLLASRLAPAPRWLAAIEPIAAWPPAEAERRFLQRFAALRPERAR